MRGETKHHDSELKRQEKERAWRKSVGLTWLIHSEKFLSPVMVNRRVPVIGHNRRVPVIGHKLSSEPRFRVPEITNRRET